jgi:hypothetical protein
VVDTPLRAPNSRKSSKKKKATEEGYNAALKGIPDSKAKADPWRGVR